MANHILVSIEEFPTNGTADMESLMSIIDDILNLSCIRADVEIMTESELQDRFAEAAADPLAATSELL